MPNLQGEHPLSRCKEQKAPTQQQNASKWLESTDEIEVKNIVKPGNFLTSHTGEVLANIDSDCEL